MGRRLALVLIALAGMAAGSPASSAPAAQSIAVFDVVFVDTSPEPETPAEVDRTRRLGESLRAELARSGQYRIVDLAPVRAKLAGIADLRTCTGCAQDLGRELGARLVAVSWVQKVSNLILNINIEITDVATGRAIKAGSVDIRGNTDESWDRGLKFLLDEHVFGDRP